MPEVRPLAVNATDLAHFRPDSLFDERERQLLLIGGGHVHIGCLRRWARRGGPAARTILITPDREFLYSGMIPGWMAGHYSREDCAIDLAALAHDAGVALCLDRVTGLDAEARRVSCGSATTSYDLLSLASGGPSDCSSLAMLGDRLLPIRPLREFVERWPAVRAMATARAGHLAVVGGGAAGIELAFAARAALTTAPHPWQVTLVASVDGVLAGFAPALIRRIERALRDRHIDVIAADAAGHEEGLHLSDGSFLAADWVIAATGGRPPAWLRDSGLCLRSGWPVVDACQHSLSHRDVFAAGDIAERRDANVARSGVHAVRAAAVVAANLKRVISGKSLKIYRPRKHTLYLIALGERRAILSWGRWAMEGRLMWMLKDWIDRHYVRASAR